MPVNVSALGPIDPTSVPITSDDSESEQKSSWIIRKLVGSMTGRIMMSSYESLRTAGTSIICLSPWGDSSPLLLPCIRFRDLAVHTVIAATWLTGRNGGSCCPSVRGTLDLERTASRMGPISDVVVGSFGDSILVELGIHAGFDLTTTVANDLVIHKPLDHILPIYSAQLETTGIKVLLITLKHKSITRDAALGFFRSSVHKDSSLFSSVKDYLAVEKGWFSPYLFASARRPIIPRTMKPDVIFCHGPFLQGDYKIGETLLTESAQTIIFAESSSSPLITVPDSEVSTLVHHHSLSIPSLSNMFNYPHSRTPSPEPALTPLPLPATPRRMVLLVVGLRPHRKMWTMSARPGESVLNYVLLNGCPAIVVPIKVGAPLVAWDGLTLEQLWNVKLPREGERVSEDGIFEGIVNVLYEYLDLCVDWERVIVSGPGVADNSKADKKGAIKDAITLLLAAAVRSRRLKGEEVGKELDEDRSGIAMWRIL